MFHSRGQIGEVVFAQGLRLLFIMQHARAVDDEIDLFLSVIECVLAIPMRIQGDFSEASYGLERSVVLVAFAEDRSVVAGGRRETDLGLRQFWNVAMQPRGVSWALLRQEPGAQQHREQVREQQESSNLVRTAFNSEHEVPHRYRCY